MPKNPKKNSRGVIRDVAERSSVSPDASGKAVKSVHVPVVRVATRGNSSKKPDRTTIPIRLPKNLVSRLYQKCGQGGDSLQEVLESELGKAEKYDRSKSDPIDASQGVEGLKRMLETERISTEIYQLRQIRQGSPQNSTYGSPIAAGQISGQDPPITVHEYVDAKMESEVSKFENRQLHNQIVELQSRPAVVQSVPQSSPFDFVDDSMRDLLKDKFKTAFSEVLAGKSTPGFNWQKNIDLAAGLVNQYLDKAVFNRPPERKISQVITGEEARKMVESGQIRPDQIIWNPPLQPTQQPEKILHFNPVVQQQAVVDSNPEKKKGKPRKGVKGVKVEK